MDTPVHFPCQRVATFGKETSERPGPVGLQGEKQEQIQDVG